MSYSENDQVLKIANQQRHIARASLLHQVKNLIKSTRTLRLIFQRVTSIPVFDRWLVTHGYRWDKRHLLLKKYPDLETRLSEQVIHYIERIHTHPKSQKVDLIVFLVPFREQLIKRSRLIPDLHDPEKPNRLLRERLTASGIQVVDLYQAYKKLSKHGIRQLYYQKDIHWTKVGNRHAAKVLTEHVLRLVEQDVLRLVGR